MYQLAKDIRSHCTEHGGIILDVIRGKVVRLNPTGALVFKGIERGQPEAALAEEIAARCRVDVNLVRADIRDFCFTLLRYKLLLSDTESEIA